MENTEVILFDLGNVLVDIHPEAFLQTLGIDTPANRKFFQPLVVDIVRRYELGWESTAQFLDRAYALFNRNARGAGEEVTLPQKTFSVEDLIQAMNSIIGDPIDGMEEIVESVGEQYHTALLSNTNPLHYDISLGKLKSLHRLHHHFLSFELQLLKPHPDIFKTVAKLLNVDASKILFIDDVLENIQGAQEASYQTILFKGKLLLEKELRDRQILS